MWNSTLRQSNLLEFTILLLFPLFVKHNHVFRQTFFPNLNVLLPNELTLLKNQTFIMGKVIKI